MTLASNAPGLSGAPGMMRSAKAATVAASSSLKNTPCSSPLDCTRADAGAAGCFSCATAPGTSPAPVAAPTAAPTRKARRASSCLLSRRLVMVMSSLARSRRPLDRSHQRAPVWPTRQGGWESRGREVVSNADARLAHVPAKWTPVRRKGHAPTLAPRRQQPPQRPEIVEREAARQEEPEEQAAQERRHDRGPDRLLHEQRHRRRARICPRRHRAVLLLRAHAERQYREEDDPPRDEVDREHRGPAQLHHACSSSTSVPQKSFGCRKSTGLPW